MGRLSNAAKETATKTDPAPKAHATKGNVKPLPVTEENFQQSFEVYIDCKTEIDRLDKRQDAVKPIIAAYVKQAGNHEKPFAVDDAWLDYNGYRVYNQFNPRWHDEHGVAWVKAELAKPHTDAEKDELNRLLVPTFDINRELWESMRDRPNSPIPVEVQNKVIPVSYKVYAKEMSKKTCEKCGTTVHKTFAFCPKCGTALAEQFADAHKAK